MIAYKIDNIQAKTGKVRIVAIANSTHYEDLARLGTTTYENLKGLSKTVSGGTFDASNLVKVGELARDDINHGCDKYICSDDTISGTHRYEVYGR